jgi:uncharacterized damage-inducible protein DinB
MAEASERKAKLREGLARDRQFLLDAVGALSEEDLARSCGHESDWTVKDLIGHIAYAEGSMIPLAQGGAAGEAHKQPPDFDIDRWNDSRIRRAREQSVPQLLERLATSREQLLALLDTLGDADLDRPVYHPTQKDTTVEGIFRIIAGHERLHAEEMRAATA